MVKKATFILTLVMIVSISLNAYAADLLWRLTHGDQDALVLGTVTEAQEDWIEVDIERTLDGIEVAEHIKICANKDRKVEPKFYWYVPQKGDFIVASIDKKSPDYEVKWGVFKVTSLDYKTLTIEKGLDNKKDNSVFQYYINNGCKEFDYYIEEEKVFVKNSDGSDIKIYPQEDKNIQGDNDLAYSDTLKEDSLQNNMSEVSNKSENGLALVIIPIFLALAVLYTYFRKGKY